MGIILGVKSVVKVVKTRRLGSLAGHGSTRFISDQEAAHTVPCAERQVALCTWHDSSSEGRGQWLAHGPWTTSCGKPRPVLEKKQQLWILVQGWFQKLPWSLELSPQVSPRRDGGERTLASSCLSHHRGWPLLPRVTTA